VKYIQLVLYIICIKSFLISQNKPNFSSPVKHKIVLSGSFGELRSGHFHSGLDIKSKRGIEGDSIFSIANGYVGRIKVEPGGYGNSLYIIHPNGFTSVYAHLKSFSNTITDYTRQNQAQRNCFTVDIHPKRGLFKIKKGDFIGLMGNSGKSFGPHLHFEIRNTKSDILINPILFGIKPKDSRPPILNSILLYEFDELMNIVHEEKILIIKENQNSYKLNKDTIFVNDLDRFSFSINLFDKMNGASNKNGVYAIRTFTNNTLFSQMQFDSIQFDDSNDIQLLLDQKIMDSHKSTNHLVDLKIQSPYSFASSTRDSLENEKSVDLKIILIDYESNSSSLEVLVTEKAKPHKSIHSNYIIFPHQESLIKLQNYTLLLRNETFQNKQGITVVEKEQFVGAQLVHTLHMDPNYQNLSNPIEILYKPKDNNLSSKWCFATYANNGFLKLVSKCKNDSICKTKINRLQNIFVIRDTIPPSIKPLFKNITFKKNNSIKFFIEDNLEPTKKSQYLTIEGTLNNVWVLFEYDLKSKTISYKINEKLEKGDYNLELQVTDNQGNSSCYFSNIKII